MVKSGEPVASFCRSVVLSPRWKPVLALLGVSVLGSNPIGAADSTCLPFPLPHTIRLTYSPQPQEDASVGCVPPIPCYASSPPSLVEYSGGLTQEIELTASPVDAISSYTFLTIWQEDWNASSSAWNSGTTIETSDVIERAIAASTSDAKYGVTGLKPGVRYQFRVAWCRLTGTVKTCNCYADSSAFFDINADGAADARPTTFPSPPLAVAAGLTARAEDQFKRPSTDPKRNRSSNALEGGDGLGPSSWNDDKGSIGANIGNGGKISIDSSGESFAELPWNSFLEYQVSTAPDDESHTLAEFEFRPHSSSAQPNPAPNSVCGSVTCNYRVSAVARLVTVAGVRHYYNVQAHYDPDWFGAGNAKATVRVQRGTGNTRPDVANWEVVGTAGFNENTGVGCVIDGTNQEATQTNTDGLRDDSRKLVRARVTDDENGRPVIYATIAWKWTGTTYDRHCTFKHIDTSLPPQHPLLGAEGGWGVLVQHFDAKGDAFRAFSGIPEN